LRRRAKGLFVSYVHLPRATRRCECVYIYACLLEVWLAAHNTRTCRRKMTDVLADREAQNTKNIEDTRREGGQMLTCVWGNASHCEEEGSFKCEK
jgi:hypothetical protein